MARMLRVSLLAAALATPALAVAQGGHSEAHRDAHEGHSADDEGTNGHGEHGAGLEAIDWNVMSGSFVNFGVWLALIYFLLRRPLSEFLRNRKAAVLEGMEEAWRIKDEAEAKYREYSERIENLGAEIERLREEVRRGGLAERDRIVAEAARKAEKMREEARFLIEQQLKQLREDLTREAIEAAVRAAAEILRRSTTPEDQQRLAEEYLGTLRTSLRQKVEEKRL